MSEKKTDIDIHVSGHHDRVCENDQQDATV